MDNSSKASAKFYDCCTRLYPMSENDSHHSFCHRTLRQLLSETTQIIFEKKFIQQQFQNIHI